MISLTINYTKPLPWCGLQTYANRVLKRCLRCGYLFKGNGKRNSTAKHKNSLSENKIYSQPVHQITEKKLQVKRRVLHNTTERRQIKTNSKIY